MLQGGNVGEMFVGHRDMENAAIKRHLIIGCIYSENKILIYSSKQNIANIIMEMEFTQTAKPKQ